MNIDKNKVRLVARLVGFEIRLMSRQEWRVKVDSNGQESKKGRLSAATSYSLE